MRPRRGPSPRSARTLGHSIPRSGRGLVVGLLLATAVWAVPAPGQERIEGNVYANPRYGIQIAKPANWYFITAGTILDLAQKAAGTSGRPRSDEDPVKAAGFAVIVSKVPALGRGFDPQVVVLVQEVAQPLPNLIEACEKLRAGMTEPETVKATREVRVDGKPAARLDFQGLVDGTMVRATALCAFRDGRAFVVVGQALSADFDREAQAFETILGSFKLR